MDAQSVGAVIMEVERRAKNIPMDQLEALTCVTMLLEVINQYQKWINDIKSEFMNMGDIIKTQEETLKKFYQKEGKTLILTEDIVELSGKDIIT